MKIALAFFGITRSLKYTIDSIKLYVLKVLKENNIEYDIYMHTFTLTNYVNIRTHEKHDNYDNNEYKLLEPDYIILENQEDIKTKINMNQYRTHVDPWKTNYNSVDNFILAQYSKSKIVEMIKTHGIMYDSVIFIRPDCMYLDKLNPNFFNIINNNTILIPNFSLHSKYQFNDRFSICNMATYHIYGNIYYDLLEISKKQSLHSETVLGQHIHNNNVKVIRVKFNFTRVRCNGKCVDIFTF